MSDSQMARAWEAQFAEEGVGERCGLWCLSREVAAHR